MVVGVLEAELGFAGSRSLKDKRGPLRSIKDRLRRHFNVSVAEVDHQDKWQRSRLAVACVGQNETHVRQILDEVAGLMERQESVTVNERTIRFH